MISIALAQFLFRRLLSAEKPQIRRITIFATGIKARKIQSSQVVMVGDSSCNG